MTDKNILYFLIFLASLVSYHFYQKNQALSSLLNDQDEALNSCQEAIESQKKYIDYLNYYYGAHQGQSGSKNYFN